MQKLGRKKEENVLNLNQQKSKTWHQLLNNKQKEKLEEK